jgi:uncharacterized protein YjbI with pentapeptide repeats
MANTEQLAILKQGAQAWNKWRARNTEMEIDLSEADLAGVDLRCVDLQKAGLRSVQFSGASLKEANLRGANLAGANLVKAHLDGANLREANLITANLTRADLFEAYLTDTNLSSTKLQEAKFQRASLQRTNLSDAQLKGSDFQEANLWRANFSEVNLAGCNFGKALLEDTIWGNADLSEAIGLEAALHRGPSRISTDTFARSKGRITAAFLRGCGLSDWEIEAVKLYNPDLSNEEINNIQYRMYDLRATQALQISPLFVSYSHADSEFVDKLGESLTEKGIRYWRDIHDMKAGRMETQIDRAIRQNPTVLLVLSEHSLKSDWVEHEARTAHGLEKEMGRDVLCPVALDGSWKDSRWPKHVMEQIMEYNILDFSAWRDKNRFGSTFRKLIDGLELFYKG